MYSKRRTFRSVYVGSNLLRRPEEYQGVLEYLGVTHTEETGGVSGGVGVPWSDAH